MFHHLVNVKEILVRYENTCLKCRVEQPEDLPV
jgi:hypothetical protein